MNRITESLYDCIIIGGGISGVSFAHLLHRQGKKVLLLEKENRLGGQIQSLSAPRTDFWFEAGAHTCYHSYTSLLSIAEDIGFINQIQPLRKNPFLAYKDNHLKKMISGISFPSLLLNGPNVFFTSKLNKTVKEYYSTIVGKQNYETFFSKLFRTILSQDADEYPAQLLMKKRESRMYEHPRRFSFQKGLSSFLEAVAEKDGFKVEQSCEVSHLNFMEEREGECMYEITTSSGAKYNASALALAVDPQTASVLLKDHEEPLAQLLSTISMYHSESLSVVVKKEHLEVPKMAGIISIADSFLSAVSRDLIPDPSLRAFTFHFPGGRFSEGEKLDTITQVLSIKHDHVLHSTATRHKLPSLRLPHLGMREKTEAVKKNKNLYLLGNYFDGVALEDCVRRSRYESERYGQ